MTRLQQLFNEQGQSPWLDNLKRAYLTGGDLARYIDAGIRGITSNPTIFQKAIAEGSAYDEAFGALVERNETIRDAFWDLVVDDIHAALHLLNPLYEQSEGGDGFVSVELDPGLARDTDASVVAAGDLRGRLPHPNVLVKIPATAEGVPAIHTMISRRCSINVTLIFSLPRYDEVIEAYLSGLESVEGDLSGIHSVASFFVSRVDNEVDRRLDQIGSPDALALRGKVAVAQAKLAYQLFGRRFSGPRWQALAARGARVQRPLWASTSTKNQA
jgi:transaldolase